MSYLNPVYHCVKVVFDALEFDESENLWRFRELGVNFSVEDYVEMKSYLAEWY
jgi:hypothetical protein